MSTSRQFSWKNSNILIADDEPDMREIFAAWFRGLGCRVTEACDGQEALDAVRRERFDAVVTDVRMPKVNGVQLVQRIHDSGRYTPIVIFVSGFVDLTLPEAFDLGVEAVLSKPCEKKDLLNAVQRSLLRRDLIFDPPPSVAPPAQENYIRENFKFGLIASQVALGRGGLSLNVQKKILPDSAVGFSLSFAQGSLARLDGWGALRWTENSPAGSRIGIEFLHLEQESLILFARWLQESCPISFIPKDCHLHSATSASP